MMVRDLGFLSVKRSLNLMEELFLRTLPFLKARFFDLQFRN